MRTVTTVIIGAGPAGLAMSKHLSDRSVDHVVLERGAVANTWRHERWDSFSLLTPNWQTRLPGRAFEGHDPDGFMTKSQVVRNLAGYADNIGAPVKTDTTVERVTHDYGLYKVQTSRGTWMSRTLVLASGAFNTPKIPDCAAALPGDVVQMDAHSYRNPGALPDGSVLVVGGSATGAQLAQEIHASGRPVTLAMGEHVRVPRRYRGRDIAWWIEASNLFGTMYDEIDDLARVRRTPSLQLSGDRQGRMLDINRMQDAGINVVGRLAGISGGKAWFSGSLPNMCTLADLKMNRLLETFDRWADASGASAEIDAPERFAPTRLPAVQQLEQPLGDISTVIWATGFAPDYSWLDLPVLDRKGQLIHDGGVVAMPGLYAMGLPFMRCRKSTLIDGMGADAQFFANHLTQLLARPLAA